MTRILTLSLAYLFLASAAAAELVEDQLPPLPDQFGFGGPAAGVHDDALIVAGGANFPDRAPWEGGDKVWHDCIFVLEKDTNGKPQANWQQVGRYLHRDGRVSVPLKGVFGRVHFTCPECSWNAEKCLKRQRETTSAS